MDHDLIVLYEHPEWQKPLLAALERRGVSYGAFDLKRAAFDPDGVPAARVYFNQASPSAYVRGNARAVPLALSLMRTLELSGARVLNGSRAFALELSKTAQAALVKPEQGGSGARMYLLQAPEELPRLLRDRPEIWLPDNLLMLQEYFEVDPARGIVRMEFLNGELLYAMRVISHGAFNLCPSEVCNPEDGASMCEIPESKSPELKSVAPVEFHAYQEVPEAAVQAGLKLMAAGGLDVGGIEYLEAADGRLIFYDVNANSNLRAPIAREFGFDPFERVVDYLVSQLTV